MATRTIDHGRGRLLIAEHPSECYVSVTVDGAGSGMFLTPDQMMEAAGELIAIARKIRRG